MASQGSGNKERRMRGPSYKRGELLMRSIARSEADFALGGDVFFFFVTAPVFCGTPKSDGKTWFTSGGKRKKKITLRWSWARIVVVHYY